MLSAQMVLHSVLEHILADSQNQLPTWVGEKHRSFAVLAFVCLVGWLFVSSSFVSFVFCFSLPISCVFASFGYRLFCMWLSFLLYVVPYLGSCLFPLFLYLAVLCVVCGLLWVSFFRSLFLWLFLRVCLFFFLAFFLLFVRSFVCYICFACFFPC